jgi:biopolymer transport protein ExbB/TolQ
VSRLRTFFRSGRALASAAGRAIALGALAAALTAGSYELVNHYLMKAMRCAFKGEGAAAVNTATREATALVRARLVRAFDRVELPRAELALSVREPRSPTEVATATEASVGITPAAEEEKRKREEAEREAAAAAEAEAHKQEDWRTSRKAKIARVQVSPSRALAAFIGEEPARDLLVLRTWVERRPVETLDHLVAEHLLPLHLDADSRRRVEALVRRQDKDHAELLDMLGRTKSQIDETTKMWLLGSPARISVIVNGWIQLATVYVFWLGVLATGRLLIRIYRWGRQPICNISNGRKVELEAWLVEGASSIHHHVHTRPGTIAHASSDAQRAAELVRMFRPIHEAPPLAVSCHAVLLAGGVSGSMDAMAEALERSVVGLRDDAESALELSRYSAWLIPSLGFVGTVVGIGNGLLNADRMITAPRELQGQEIARITGYLGFAFDTTLVALILSAIVVLLIHSVHRSTERQIERIRGVVKRLVLDRYEPTLPLVFGPQPAHPFPSLPGVKT